MRLPCERRARREERRRFIQYRRDDDRSIPVDEANVTRILAQRTTAKMSRDFNTADALREELRGMGVEVNDQERTWKMRGAGPGGGGYGGGGGAYGGGGGRDDRGPPRRNAEEDFGDLAALRRQARRSRSRSAERERAPRQSRFS